jgi:hypothetical protein
MSRPPPPTQLSLHLGDPRNRPPAAAPTPDLIETLASLLLAAMAGLRDREAGDEPEDRR